VRRRHRHRRRHRRRHRHRRRRRRHSRLGLRRPLLKCYQDLLEFLGHHPLRRWQIFQQPCLLRWPRACSADGHSFQTVPSLGPHCSSLLTPVEGQHRGCKAFLKLQDWTAWVENLHLEKAQTSSLVRRQLSRLHLGCSSGTLLTLLPMLLLLSEVLRFRSSPHWQYRHDWVSLPPCRFLRQALRFLQRNHS
jgi:hypothetical protein